jgi:hypothetical protein
MVASLVAIHGYAAPGLRAYAFAALSFMIVCAAITSSVNFALLMTSLHPQAAGPALSLFLPYRWPSIAYALDLLAWDGFFGLAVLFAAPVFSGPGLERAVRVIMILTGAVCLIGLIGILSAGSQGLGIAILGYSVGAPVVFVLLAVLFGRARPSSGDAP